MIKSIRVDYRLLHGQVAVSWTASLGADCLLLVSDTVKNDPLRLNALKMAKPSGTKVVVKNTAEAVEALKQFENADTERINEKYSEYTIQQHGNRQQRRNYNKQKNRKYSNNR